MLFVPKWPLRRVLRWLGLSLFVLLVVVPVVFAAVFLGIQHASEREWLGKAPQHEAIDVRLREPHAITLLDVGFDSLATRLRLIESAQQTIELEFFIYELDEAARLISQALARKATEGVQVRILVDFALPVFKLAPQVARTLEAAGVQVRYYNTSGIARFFAMQHRTHRKLLVVDRQRAIVGGRNIGNDYFDLSDHYNFLDSDLLIHGPIAAAIADSFELYWGSDWVTDPQTVAADQHEQSVANLLSAPSATETALLADLQRRSPAPPTGTCGDMQFITDYPGSGVERRKVYPAIAALVHEAKQRVVVESPYLVLRGDGLALTASVLQRGVQVQFLTNTLHSTDAFYTVASLADSLDQLQLPGLQVWGYDGRPLPQDDRPPASARWGVHAKRALFDDHTVVIGTYNIDPRSANLNSELIVICRDNPALAQAVGASLQARLAQSRPVVGTPQAGGYQALVQGADAGSIWRMRLVQPLASWLDFLL
ncbi:phospholipase D-like domain-containing protein [Ottowia sp.]|uniref:phospholipase D-like domain-containing protein n=1 Tax=Ottowia sp. TaxID=1898956 RepID=UPI003A880F22